MNREAASSNPKLPRHVAIIMDGNGRWANQRHLPRIGGHHQGAKAARKAISEAARRGVKYLTLYAFSVENWTRPKAEVAALMQLLIQTLKEYEKELDENDVRLRAIGRLSDLPANVRKQLDRTIEKTAGNKRMTLILALSYSSRVEILEAVRQLAREVEEGKRKPSEIDEEDFSGHLYTAEYPDPDLLIRTSGEMRVSNFLLWQLSYTEIYVTQTLWPDFDEAELVKALEEYGRRERRFGGV